MTVGISQVYILYTVFKDICYCEINCAKCWNYLYAVLSCYIH